MTTARLSPWLRVLYRESGRCRCGCGDWIEYEWRWPPLARGFVGAVVALGMNAWESFWR